MDTETLRGLFINNKKAKDSIYESGWMSYQCLLLSNKFTLDYKEIDDNDRIIQTGFDFYFLNFHPSTMQWMETRNLKKKLGFCITLVLEISPNDPFILCSSKDFDAYCVLDPTIKHKNKKVYPFPRPLEKVNFTLPIADNKIPIIGSFGFATKGKGFEHVVEAVNKEFEQATIKLNIPHGDFVPDSKKYAEYLADNCIKLAKPGIEVKVTHEFLSKEDLIKWCASNTLNCFLYDRNMPGLAATTDQAIVSGAPLSISNNDTFRHITYYLPPYPRFSLKESIVKSGKVIEQIKKDWSPEKFAEKFEELLAANKRLINKKAKKSTVFFELPLKKFSLIGLIEHRYYKYARKLKKVFN